MKKPVTCPDPEEVAVVPRRRFLKSSLAACAAGLAGGLSCEEKHLLAQKPVSAAARGPGRLPAGRIGNVSISRLICGGNLISGYAHSRDLIYVSPLLEHYFTDEKILETWQLCEEHGINTMIVNPRDRRAVQLFRRYRRERGGEMQWIAQAQPDPENLSETARQAIDNGAAGVFLVGNLGDRWTFSKRVDRIGDFVEAVQKEGVIAGVAGHSMKMLEAVEAARIPNDFYMKTIHRTDYWSARRPDQNKPVVDNYAVDNYFDLDPEKTAAAMAAVEKPWIAYKVLAAGALAPGDGFEYAFQQGADFLCVGMFDFQIAEDAHFAARAFEAAKNRPRPWRA